MKNLLLICVSIFCNIPGVFAQCITPSLTSVSTGGAVCAGSTLNLNANGPANVTGYTWTGPNSFTSSAQDPSITGATTAAGGVYTVVVVNGTGTCSATYTVAATVNAAPVTSYITNQNPVCKGTQMVISPGSAWCNPFALNCNGVNSIGSTAAPISTAIDNITMEAWVEWTGGADQIIFWNGNAASNGYSLQIVDGSGTLYIVLGGVADLSTSAQLTLGVRQHVAIVRTAGVWSVYLNGLQYPVAGGTGTPNTPTTGFYLGNNTSGTNTFNGYIGNVAFWTTARSTAQIQADMNSCSLSPQTGLAAYWGLGDGIGTSITDGSGNGNTLTLAHTTWHSTAVSGAYVWNFGDGSATATGSAPVHTYTTSGTYTVGVTSSMCSGTASKVVTVESAYVVNSISGSVFVCSGSSANLTDVTTGGAWTSSATGVATVGSTGMVSGIAGGTASISYSKTNSCGAITAVSVATINQMPAISAITGSNTVCSGTNITLSDPVSGGTWYSATTGIATVGTGGIVTGVSAGTVTISYTESTAYCSQTVTTAITVVSTAGDTISGTSNICVGSSTLFTDALSGGIWSSSDSAIITLDGTGNITSVATGTAIISYSLATCGSTVVTKNVTSNALPTVTFTAQPSPPLCTSTPVTYTTQAGQSNYIWSLTGTAGVDYLVTGGSPADTSNSVSVEWLTQFNGTVSVNYTDINGCASGANTTLSINGPATGPYSIISTPSCAGSSVTVYTDGSGCGNYAYDFFEGNAETFNNYGITDNLTMEAWITKGTYAYQYVEAFYNGDPYSPYESGYGLRIYPNGQLTIVLPGVAELVSSAYIQFGLRCHVAIVRNSGVWSIYLNGVQYSVTNNTASPSGTAPLNIWSFDGLMTNLAFWNMPRSTAQIQADMNSCSLAPQANLVSYWPLNDASSAAVGSEFGYTQDAEYDQSGNGNTLLLGYEGGYFAGTNSSTAYLWDFGDGGIGAGNAPTHAYAAAGSYTVNVTSELCGGSSTLVVNVIDTLPTIGAITGTNVLCPGVSTQMSNTAASGTWSSSNIAVATVSATGVVHTILPGTTTISYSLNNSCGTSLATSIVTVNLTTPAFTANPAAQTCANINTTYTTDAGELNYIWSIPGSAGIDYLITSGGSGTASNTVTLEWLTPGIKTVTINYTGTNGCNAVAGTRDTTEVMLPDATFTAISNPTCVGIGTSLLPNVANCGQYPLIFGNGYSLTYRYSVITTAIDNITMEAWVQWDGTPNGMIFLNGDNGSSGYGLYVANTAGQLELLMGGVSFATSSAVLPLGVRTHVAIVRNSGVWSIYVNATPYTISTPTATPNTPGNGFFVGNDQGLGTTFGGIISNVAFWNVARSGTQIQADMSACTLSTQVGLIGYWALGEASGNVGYDGTGNNRNLNINNPYRTEPLSTYTWSFGDGGTSTAYNPTHTYTASGMYTPTLTVTNTTGCSGTATTAVLVNTPPNPGTVSGTQVMCPGTILALADAVTGGVWSSANSAVGTIGTSGIVAGITPGTTVISYTINNGCGNIAATSVVTVSAVPDAGTITGASVVCIPATTALTDAAGSGTWSSSNIAVATVGTDGTVTGAIAGSATISYTVSNSYCASSATQAVTVSVAASAGSIAGGTTVCTGAVLALSDNISGGTWYSSNAAAAIVGSANGSVTGVAAGTTTISYTVTGTCNTSIAIQVLSVNPTPAVSFIVAPTANSCLNIPVTYTTQSGQNNYTWNIPGISGTDYTITGGGTEATSNSATIKWQTTGAKVVTLNYTNSVGCSALTAIPDTTSIAIPSASFYATPNPVCSGSAATFASATSCYSSLLTFNGSNSAASVSAPITTVTDNLTIEAWVQWNGGGGQFIFANGNPYANGYALWVLNSGGTLGINLGNVALLTTSVTLSPGVRTHVVIERNSGTWMLYIDGVSYPVPSSGSTPITPATGFYVGYSGSDESFNGTISNVAFWTTARSAAQIRTDMASCTLSPQAGLAGYWALGEGTGATGNDISGNNNNLALQNIRWSVPISAYTWSFGDGSTSTATNPAYSYTTAGTFTPSLTVTNTAGCSNTATTTVSVNVTPTAGAISGAATVCMGGTQTLTDATTGGVWSSSNTATGTVSAGGAVTGIVTGTTTISYTVTNACSAATATMIMTVDMAPVATFTTAASSVSCAQVPVTYTTQSGQTNYIWSVQGTAGTDYTITGGGIGTTNNGVTLEWITGGSKTVTATYTAAGGCPAAGSASNATTVNVPLPAYCAANPNPACAGIATALSTNSSCNTSFLNFNTSYNAAYTYSTITSAIYNTTLETWIQWNGGANQDVLVNGSYPDNGYMLIINDAGAPTLNLLLCGSAMLTSSAQLTQGQMNHVAIVCNAGTWSIYVNGVQYSFTNATAGAYPPTGLCLGNNSGDLGGNPFNGIISNVALWNVARSTAQIQADMGTCTQLPQAGLAGYWQLGEGSGSIGNDVSGNGNDLALAGTDWTTAPTNAYSWNFGDGNTSTTPNPSHSYTAAGTYTASVTVTNTLGCGTNATAIVTVNVPVAAGTITGIATGCTGYTNALSDAVAGGMWSSSNAAIAIVSTAGIVTGVGAGTALISYTINNGCITNTTTTETVNATVSVFTTAPSAPVCAFTPVTYSVPTGQSNYVWTIPGTAGVNYIITNGGTSSTDNSVTLAWQAANTYSVTVGYTAPGGCGTASPASTITTVNTAPNPNYAVNPNPACAASTISFASQGWCSGSVLGFNNSNASVGTPISTAIDNVTIEAWVLWNGGSNQTIFLNGNGGSSGYGLNIFNTSGQLQIIMGDVAFSQSPATIPVGTRTNVAIVRNSGTWTVYVNGIGYPIDAPTATPLTPGTGFFVGNDNGGGTGFNGIIGNVAFWNSARTPAQILADMSTCTQASQTDLAGYWQLSEGSGSVAYDASGNGNNLNLNNTSWIGAPTTGYTYEWSFGDGATSTQGLTTHSYSTPGTYSSSLTIGVAGGCTTVANVTVTVNNTPIIAAITGTTLVCAGSSISMSDATAGGVWSSADSTIAAADTTGNITGRAAGTVLISYTENNGCQASATTLVTVNTTTPSFTSTPPVPLCLGTDVMYTTQPGQTNYTWTISGVPGTNYNITAGGTGATSNSVTLNWQTQGNNIVTVNYIGANGCAAAVPTADTTIINTSLPNATFQVNPNPTCMNNVDSFAGYNGWCNPNVADFSNYYEGGGYAQCNGYWGYNGISGTNEFTFESWVQWNGSPADGDQGIFSYQLGYDNYGLAISSMGYLEVVLRNGAGFNYLVSSALLPVNVHVHTAVTYSAANGWIVYMNGIPYPISSTQAPNLPESYGEYDYFYLGYNNFLGATFNGLMGNAAFWTAARDSASITADMNSCSFSPQTNLAGYWPMNEGTGGTIYDSSGHAVNMTSYGTWKNTATVNTYTWSYGDGTTDTGNNAVHTYSVAGVYVVSVIAANSAGCSSTASQPVTVTPGPTLTSASAGVVCAGGTLNLFANTPTLVTSYSWAGPNSFSASSQNPSIGEATAAASGTYTVTLIGGGCSLTYTTTATVNAAPVLASAVAPSLACIGGTLDLHVDTPANVTGYAWLGPNSFNSTSASPVLSGLTTAASGVYSVTVNNGIGSGCTASYTTAPVQVITVPIIGPINGDTAICGSGTSMLSDTTAAGDWFSTDPTIASVDEVTGVVTGISNGTVDIGYAADNLCGINERFAPFTVNSGVAPISGVNNICTGTSATLSDAASGGVWSSSNTSIATVNGSTGNVIAAAAGIVTITYSTGSCSVTTQVTVNASGSAGSISGTTTTCIASATTLTDAVSGGVWGSSSTGIATVGSTGVVMGVAMGTAIISYAINNTCGSESTSVVVTVNASANAGSISGLDIVCASATTSLSDGAGGGIWSSGNTSVATVGASGLVTGVAVGTSIISYAVTNSCGAAYASVVVTVNPSSNAGSISGTDIVCQGSTTNLTDMAGGGVWSSGNSSIATVGSSGIVTGVAVGTVTISYAVSGGCGNAYTTSIVTVNTTSAGSISGPSSVTTGLDITLTDIITGGTWSASNTDASVSGGIVTGVTAGTVIISYAVSSVCGVSYATEVITVNNTSLTGISGNTNLCSGGTTTLMDATTGGTWSMSSLVATIAGSTGVVTASNAYSGTATVTYTAGALSATIVITVNPNPTPIQVAGSACAGTTVTLSDATIGGAWSGTGDATISGTGTSGTFVAGAVAGSVMITYTLPSGCYLTTSRSVYASPLPITGAFNVCVGGVTNLSDASPVLNWFSSNTAVATVLGSNVTGVSSGTTIITFQSSATGYCITTQVVTVSAQPASITGNSGALCPGSTEALADGAGTWTSSSTAVATIASTGVVTGVAGGTTIVSYLEAGTAGCTANTVVTVNTVAAITGSTAMCLGGTTVLNDATTGGTWLSGAPGTATVNAAGLVTGTGEGTAMITYTTAGGCAKTVMVTVSGVSAAISGNLFLCNGTTTTLSDASAGGTWSMSSNIATAGSATGIITASASYTGTATISYVSGSCSVSAVLTVSAHPAAIQGAAGECAGVTTSLTDVTAGGTWNVSGDATISGSGASATLVAGATGGTAIVSYSLGTGCMVTSTNTIYAGPQPITGNFNLCVGLVTDLTDASPVNSWSSSNTAIATVAGPDVTGHAVGVATITFKSSAAGYCITTQTITVNAMPVVTAINGPATISNVGSPVSISDATAGGIWTSSNTSVITLSGSTGSPINATALTTTGSSIITYAVTIAGCTTKVTRTYAASAAGHAGTITVYAGDEVSVADDIPGGIWSSNDNEIAIVDGNGSVRGIVPGSVIITHELTGDDGAVSRTTNVIVSAASAIINVLPNPNKGVFTVRGTVGSMADEVVTLEVTDLLGQVIYRSKVTAYKGKLNETITLSNALANGMYILNVQCAMETKTFHFVVEQ